MINDITFTLIVYPLLCYLIPLLIIKIRGY